MEALETQEVNQITRSNSSVEVAQSQQAQGIQASMVVAKKFPRNEIESMRRIKQSCKRKGLAENAIYAYPRGGSQVSGPSIRLAENIAQNWGNIDFGIIELSQVDGESQVMAYAHDMETNAKSTKIFTVKHERKARGAIIKLDDSRDVYELVANMGARRLRACILAVIPQDIVEDAVEECEKTLHGDNDEPLKDRISKMLTKFEAIGVTAEMVETRMQKSVDALLAIDIVNLGKIYKSINDSMSKVDDWFEKVKIEGPKPKQSAPSKKKKNEKPKTKEPKSEDKTSAVTPPPEDPEKVEDKTPPVTPPEDNEGDEIPMDFGDKVEGDGVEKFPEDVTGCAEDPAVGNGGSSPLMDKLAGLVVDAGLTTTQLFAWAKSKNFDLEDDAKLNQIIGAFQNVKNQIAKF